MRIVYKTSGGLDVHKKNVVVSRMRVGAHGKKVSEIHTSGPSIKAESAIASSLSPSAGQFVILA